MPRYLSLISFTDEGIRKVKDSVKRADAFKVKIEEAGGKVKGMYWAVGEFDGALISEAPDEGTANALLLSLGSAGFVRTRTLRLLDATEFGDALQRK
jgi:uncharacterized protein with GYD domain